MNRQLKRESSKDKKKKKAYCTQRKYIVPEESSFVVCLWAGDCTDTDSLSCR